MRLIAEGATSKVYDNCDGTITKVFNGNPNEILPGIDVPHMKYVANCKVYSNCIEEVVKEKIYIRPDIPEYLAEISRHWDNSLLSSHELFDYLNEYLRSNKKPLKELRTPSKFIDYLYVIGCGNSIGIVVYDLFALVQELKDFGIYNVDWNPENFGFKHGNLALCELGGAKLHRK